MAKVKIGNTFLEARRECTLEAWRKSYRREVGERMLTKDIFSRVRARTGDHVLITTRGEWGRSDIFARCKFCGGLTIYGVCQTPECGSACICCRCGRILQPDGYTWKRMVVQSQNFTHTYCDVCAEEEFPHLYNCKSMLGVRYYGNN